MRIYELCCTFTELKIIGRNKIKLLKYLVVVLLFSVSSVWSGDFEDAELAFNTKNYLLALSKYKKSASKGNGDAAFQVGFIYSNGLGVAKDYSESRNWFKLSVSLGKKEGGFDIGMQYKDGSSVPKDYVRAHMWLNIASIDTDYARPIRDNLEEKMTPQQIAEAQKLATECQARKFKNCD